MCVSAQDEPIAGRAQRLLRSANPRDKAWGAWYAGAAHDPSLRDSLVAELRRAQPLANSGPETAGYALIQSLFDALIEIPGSVPSDAILPFEAHWRAEILILLSRDSANKGNEAALLAMRDHEMPDDQLAAIDDLLFEASRESFLANLLPQIRITHDFFPASRGWALCDSLLISKSERRFPKDFPPTALYELSTSGWEGSTILLKSLVTVYYRLVAVVPTDDKITWETGADGCYGSVPSARQAMLDKLLHDEIGDLYTRETRDLLHPLTGVEYEDLEPGRAEIDRKLDEQSNALIGLFQQIQQRSLARTSGMHFAIEVRLHGRNGTHTESRVVVVP
jgi:hypothetical protein